MISYRFKRRAFLAALGGAAGLKLLLRNLEASAQSAKSPARLLVTHWPVGIVAGAGDALWKPTSGSVTGSYGLKPFDTAGLGADMTVFRGMRTSHLNVSGGGSHEQGTVVLVTGINPGGSRANNREGDDAYAAAGGSFDQLMLSRVASLKSPLGGQGYANSAADTRTDFGEKSTQTLSYSMTSGSVRTYSGGNGTEAIPLAPQVSPLAQFDALFKSFVPGSGGTSTGGSPGTTGGSPGTGGAAAGAAGTGPRTADETLRTLANRRSVLDFAIEEINQLMTMAPSGARDKLRVHLDEITKAEDSVRGSIDMRYPGMGTGTGGRTGTGGTSGAGTGSSTGGSGTVSSCMACSTKPMAPPTTEGKADPTNGAGSAYGNARSGSDDMAIHQSVAKAHMDVLKAAFVCDVIRVATFQYSPGTNHVGFKGLYPGDEASVYQHHPLSHDTSTGNTTKGNVPDDLAAKDRFLFNVQLWYFQRHAETLAAWKSTVDGCGNSLLDYTAIPYLTEVRATGHERDGMAAMLIGGKKLGFTHNLYRTDMMTINQFWGTVAQAFGYTSPAAPFSAPVSGLWTKPA
jgi:hypothetical protein